VPAGEKRQKVCHFAVVSSSRLTSSGLSRGPSDERSLPAKCIAGGCRDLCSEVRRALGPRQLGIRLGRGNQSNGLASLACPKEKGAGPRVPCSQPYSGKSCLLNEPSVSITPAPPLRHTGVLVRQRCTGPMPNVAGVVVLLPRPRAMMPSRLRVQAWPLFAMHPHAMRPGVACHPIVVKNDLCAQI
jgi:hypothetical protein